MPVHLVYNDKLVRYTLDREGIHVTPRTCVKVQEKPIRWWTQPAPSGGIWPEVLPPGHSLEHWWSFIWVYREIQWVPSASVLLEGLSGPCKLKVGGVQDLPVLLLIEQDCPSFPSCGETWNTCYSVCGFSVTYEMTLQFLFMFCSQVRFMIYSLTNWTYWKHQKHLFSLLECNGERVNDIQLCSCLLVTVCHTWPQRPKAKST